jgi:GTP-binding protein HflX
MSLNTADLNPVVERAWLVGISDKHTGVETAESLLDELAELVGNLSIGIVGRSLARVRDPSAAFWLGKGTVERILDEVAQNNADCIIFDAPLSPAQQRNWEEAAGGKVLVIDRQEVILDIFNQRAQTTEARLQVELARLEYELPRMKRAWSHLDRQRGGGALQRDAGETQLELDQRMIRERIARLKGELATVVKRRDVQRRKRARVPLPTAAIIGYTNAGKSSLLNRVCEQADVLAADKLFATLDPTTRRATLPSGQTLLLTDTVGFIRRLPHRLVDAFKATLEEAVVSDVLIHLLDASSPDVQHHYETTRAVLSELKAEDKSILTVFNKVDACADPARLVELHHAHPEACFISVHTGEGLEELLQRCEKRIEGYTEARLLLVPHDQYAVISSLHEAGAVTRTEAYSAGVLVEGKVPLRLLPSIDAYRIDEHRARELRASAS